MKNFLKTVDLIRRGEKNASKTIVGFGDDSVTVTKEMIVVKEDGEVTGTAKKESSGWTASGCISQQEAELISFCYNNRGRLKKYRKKIIFRGRETTLSPEGVFLGGYQVAWPNGDRFVTERAWKGVTTAEILLLYLKNGVEPPTLTV